MKRASAVVACLVACLWFAAIEPSPAWGQAGSTTASLSGRIVDPSGAVLPGADVTVTDNATGATYQAVTGPDGTFRIPALNPGRYTAVIALAGFKTVQLPDVEVNAAQPANLRAVLEIGEVQETILVTGASEIVQTQTSAVSTMMTSKQISSLPLPTRNSLDFVSMLPGIDTATTIRNSTVMGLRASATNITIDGVNVQDNYLKSSDGFFARINPRLDAVEEVTVSTANPGAESAGQGAVQIRFVTRSGSNTFAGSAYHYIRRPWLNTNYWFNERDGLPRDQVKVDTFGFRVGGPVVRNRFFYFFNYEEFRQPNSIARNRTILTADAQNGLFRYGPGGAQSVNLLALAAANGQSSSFDPITQKLLADIRASTTQEGSLTALNDPNVQRFSWQPTGEGVRRYPTTRVDYNMTDRHKVGVSYYYQKYDSKPDILNSDDPVFPGFPATGSQTSGRWSVMGQVRSMLGTNLVNEARAGATGGPVEFRPEIAPDVFANQGGFGLLLNGNTSLNLSNAYNSRNPSIRDAPTYVIEDSLNWLRGNHAFTMGGTFTQVDMNLASGNVVPSISFGTDTTDPAFAMFSTASFPGASTTELANARFLYAALTGRVTAITGAAVLDGSTGNYVYMGKGQQLGYMRNLGTYVQDSWRITPALTLNLGLRWELQLPFVAGNDFYSQVSTPDGFWGVSGPNNMFKPGTLTGTRTAFTQYEQGSQSFNTDWTNFAPSVGAAWAPTFDGKTARMILGNRPVFRAGYSLAYLREGMATYANIFSFNPGGSITATRSIGLGNLGSVPLLLRDTSRLGPPPFAQAPSYPLTNYTVSDSANVFDQNTATPYAHSFSAGFQRELSVHMALEVRYVGTRGRNGWVDGGRNYNEVNLRENGFLAEFKVAQANLQANQAAGRGNSFAYFGPGTGTQPLPILLGFFTGTAASGATDPSRYAASIFTNSTFINRFSPNNPLPRSLASDIYNDATRRANGIAAGYPSNFFVVNPDFILNGIFMTKGETFSNYDAVQVELRRRMSEGLLVQGSYVFGTSKFSSFFSHREPADTVHATNDTRHALKLNWVYELPFGRGRRFGADASRAVDALIGGWEFSGGGVVRSGRVYDFGNVRLVGMSDKEFADMFKIRIDPTTRKVYYLPQDVIDNSVRAFNVDVTSPTGYSSRGAPTGKYIAPAGGQGCAQDIAGDCAPRHHFVTGPIFTRFDMSLVKRFNLVGRMKMELRAEFLNVFDNVNFTPAITTNTGTVGSPAFAFSGGDPNNYEVTTAFRDTSNTQDPGGRLTQLSYRITW